MFGLFSRALAISILGILLTACGTRPKQVAEVPQIYEIRAVTVTANAGIPNGLLRGIKQRLDRAIHDTVRPIPMPRAVMDVHIVSVTKSAAYDGIRTQTELSVALTDVPSGQAVLVRSFLIYSFTVNDRGADNGAAEAIAARLRVEYALNQPAIREPVDTAPGLSTRMNTDDQPVEVKEERPIVIPLKTAPLIGADQDPLLNSKTHVEPEKKPAVVPDAKLSTDNAVPAENALESGAKAKVVIQPKVAEPAADEPCVETMDKKC